MFFNEVELKQNQRDVVDSKHSVFDFSKGFDHTIIFIILIIFMFFFNNIMSYMTKILIKLNLHKEVKSIDEMDFNENLGSYFECIIGQEQKRWFTKETHMRNKLNIKQVDDTCYEFLKKSHRKRKYIMNITNFDILFNPDYAENLFYSKMGQRDDNVNSDTIIQLLYLGEQRYNGVTDYKL